MNEPGTNEGHQLLQKIGANFKTKTFYPEITTLVSSKSHPPFRPRSMSSLPLPLLSVSLLLLLLLLLLLASLLLLLLLLLLPLLLLLVLKTANSDPVLVFSGLRASSQFFSKIRQVLIQFELRLEGSFQSDVRDYILRPLYRCFLAQMNKCGLF